MQFDEEKRINTVDGTVKIGTCTIDGHPLKRVEKSFEGIHNYKNVQFATQNFRRVLDMYGPHVYFLDDHAKAVYMEFIGCETLASYCINIDTENKEGHIR